ncbi:hypothetical protein WJX73_003993 [Symbiochloris irregularis]|uniref:Uncharacterized protein n=1 Tax=Symbiochloris irregularis TaxID=706552 RepID=A0AAW1P529_9CHLO
MSDRARAHTDGAFRKRSLSPEDKDRFRQRKRSRRDEDELDRHGSRDRRFERPRSVERGLALSAEERDSELQGPRNRWHEEREPELSSGGMEGTYGPFNPGRNLAGGRSLGGRGHLTLQGRTGRAAFGGLGSAGRVSEAGGRERGRFTGRWGGRGRMSMDHPPSMVWGARGGRFEGPGASELGPSGMRAGRGFGRSGEWQGMNGHAGRGTAAGPPQPAIDPAVLERRRKSIAARLRRQVAGLQVPADLVEEGVLERLAEVKAAEGTDLSASESAGMRPVSSSYMFKAMGADERERLPICQQRFDQTQAFEYCLQLYQAVSDIHLSKYGHFVSTAAAAASVPATR